MKSFCFQILVVGLLLAFAPAALYPASKPKLAAPYREFSEGAPSLLITSAERTAFLALQTDAERDKFIEHFWEVRNPTPGLETNAFKEEFYRRLAYANAYYGNDAGTDGWRTDRGRTYILFGKPQTSMSYYGNQELYRTELWFYANPGLSELPQFFYVLFYEGDGVSGERFYQPYIDGPEKLFRSGGMSKSQAYNQLRSMNAELASATLSFIPGEPLDTQTFNGSMASMRIVEALQAYNEMPSYAAKIAARYAKLERVSSKVSYQLSRSSLSTFLARQDGAPWVHWRMEVNDPTQPKWEGGKARYHVHSRLFSHGRLVLEQEDSPSFAVPEAAAESILKRPLIYEDSLPIADGPYQLTVTVTNEQTKQSYEASKEFSITSPSQERTTVGDILIIAAHQPSPRKRAYSFGGVVFTPADQNAVLSTNGLSVLYQIQLPAQRPEALTVHYTLGSVAGELRKNFDEKLDLKDVDASGALLTAKTFPIPEFSPGQYRLSIRVEDPATTKVSAAAVPFMVVSELPGGNPIVIARGQNDGPQALAIAHYERALCLLAQDQSPEAVRALQSSWELSRNPTVKTLLDRLAGHTTGTADSGKR